MPVKYETDDATAEAVPLTVRPAVAAALEAVGEALRTDARFRQRVLLMVGRAQTSYHRGPLTDLVNALAAEES